MPLDDHTYEGHQQTTEQCANKALKRIDDARREVAKVANQDVSFTHVRFYDARCKRTSSSIALRVDVEITCSAKYIHGILDSILN